MNSQTIKQTSTEPLRKYINAVIEQDPEAAHADSAQRKLVARLDRARTDPGNGMTGRRWGWATAAVAAVLLPALLWTSGPGSALAFAEVQRYFSDFETLTTQMTTRVGGNPVVEMTIRIDDRDRVRLDSGSSFSYVIDPGQSMMLQLFHPQKRAALVPLAEGNPVEEADDLDWLAEIRAFQGQAELLEQTAVIQGQEAFGFSLNAGGMDMTLWATESGEPLSLQMAGPGGVETRMDFAFDRPLDEKAFSLAVPADYRLLDSAGADGPLD